MSTSLDLVRSIYADWGRGDFGSAAWARPQIAYVIADGPTPGRRSGLTGMMEGSRTFLSAWEHWCAKPEEYRELDEQRVLVLSHWAGRGKTSAVELGQIRNQAAALFHVDGGRVSELVLYWDRDRALADLGLEG